MKRQPAVTELQAELTAAGASSLERYQQIVVGSPRLADFLLYELVATFVLPFPGAIGGLLRRKCLGWIVRRLGTGARIGRSLTLRHPRSIRIGAGVSIDDLVSLDAKGDGAAIEIGNDVGLGAGTILVTKGGRIEIGDGTRVGAACRLSTQNRLRVGRSVRIGPGCYLGAANHRFERTDVPVIAQGMDAPGHLEIEDGVQIGAGATIMSGVRLGHGAVVEVRSLVSSDVPPFAFVAGAPARTLRIRDSSEGASGL